MGIVNVTGNSFYDGGNYLTDSKLLNHVAQLINEGADLIDLGAVSTKPGSFPISEEEEMQTLQPKIAQIVHHFPEIALSVDTFRAEVAKMAVQEGVAMINDVSGGTFDAKMLETVAHLRVPYCLTHTPATPDKMQESCHYEHILAEMLQFFGEKLHILKSHGINDVLIDPGFGFGKTVEQNWHLLKHLPTFAQLGFPLLVGVSRKSMIYKLLGQSPADALNGTTVAHTIALLNGAAILRVHDVKAAKEAITIVETMNHLKIC